MLGLLLMPQVQSFAQVELKSLRMLMLMLVTKMVRLLNLAMDITQRLVPNGIGLLGISLVS